MNGNRTSKIPEILSQHEAELLSDWLQQLSASVRRSDLVSDAELRAQCAEFLQTLRTAAARGNLGDLQNPEWTPLRELLSGISRSRAVQGFTPRETSLFVLSFKRPLFEHLRTELGGDVEALAADTWLATELLDDLALSTMEAYQKAREEVIRRQQEELMELSTPVVKLWDGILALPLIGTLDSARTQTVMENLLERIVETGAEIAIIDITGVPTVDTLTAQHLLKTVTAARLMGADCIISGIRPQIAQTIVHLGVELGEVVTKASLASAFALALQRAGVSLARSRS
jgi:rsbT co-antagonist protein RsbR